METTEQRLSNQEKEIAQLKKNLLDLAEQVAILKEQQESASNIDRALLNRVDAFGGQLQRFERETKRSFEFQSMQLKTIADTLTNHKQAIEELAAGQRQIIGLLTGESRRND